MDGRAIKRLRLTRVRAEIRRQLNALAIPTCVSCGYDMTGNASGVCPECGAAIKGFVG